MRFSYELFKTLVLIFEVPYNRFNMGMDFRKSRTLGSSQSMHGKILVGLSFLALTFLTVKTFAPGIKSNAETRTAEQTAGPYTMSISTDSLTSINITPTSSQAIYAGTSAISYTNTCPRGMNVTMSSSSENTSLTRTGSDSGPKEIPTISSGTALTDNTWGFSKDNGSTYNAIPTLANPATIIDTTSATTTAVTLNLIYGVKTDNQLPSGSYSNNIIYTVSAKQQCLSYGITWNLDGGTAASGATYPASLTFGSTLDLTSLTPTKEGYEFTSWSNGANTFDGTETAADVNPTNSPSLTMTAQWTSSTYTLTYDNQSGSGCSSKTGTYGSTWGTLCTPTRSGYAFNGWYTGTNGSGTQITANSTVSDNLTVYAKWELACTGIGCISKMQAMTGSICAATAIGTTATLTDVRDNNTYTVAKLADGKCWMTENLRLTNKTISRADSNLPYGVTYTVPASDASSFTESYNTNSAYLDSTYGGYYNFYTATAGWGTDSVTSGNSPKDICPKGWSLPTGGSSGEFKTLYNNYNSISRIQGEPNFALSGHVSNGIVYDQGTNGFFWSSTVPDANSAYDLALTSPNVFPDSSSNKYLGFSVRCVAKDRTISDFTYMQDVTPKIVENTPIRGTATLIDIRDNNTYFVRKLKDGKIWMTENLRLINKTISSADSNLPSGETFTVPASSLSSFTESYNTNSAYLESTTNAYYYPTPSGYYSFYTATAGWGTDDVTSGNSPKDICPKGWRLPTGGSSGEFKTLYNNYNTLVTGDPYFALNGYVSYSSYLRDEGYEGYFWSSTVRDAHYAYDLNVGRQSAARPAQNDDKYYGYSVRCLAV